MLLTHHMDNEYIPVIISTTEKWLWENNVPSSIITHIVNKRIGFNLSNIHTIPRHVFALREAFEIAYGYDILRCPFAKYVHVPREFLSSYQVVRPECYRNIFYNEMVDINLDVWYQNEMAFINVEMCEVVGQNDQKVQTAKKERIDYIKRIYEHWKYRKRYIE